MTRVARRASSARSPRPRRFSYPRRVALLQLTNLEKVLGDRLIFDKLSFTIDPRASASA